MSSRSRPPTPNASTPLRTCRSACSFRTFVCGVCLCVVAPGAIHATQIHAFDSLRLRVIGSCGWPSQHSCVSLSWYFGCLRWKFFSVRTWLPCRVWSSHSFINSGIALHAATSMAHTHVTTRGYYCLASFWQIL